MTYFVHVTPLFLSRYLSCCCLLTAIVAAKFEDDPTCKNVRECDGFC